MCKMLIKAGAQFPNIHSFVRSGNLEAIDFIINEGIKSSTDLLNFDPPLYNQEMVKFLIMRGAKVSEATFEEAIYIHSLPLIELLIESGALITENIHALLMEEQYSSEQIEKFLEIAKCNCS